MTQPTISELDFLRKLQRLLDEGEFVATYKFALLNALADLSVEQHPEPDGSLRLPLTAIAEKFIEYYWRQARPYRAADARGIVLKQNTGSQAAVVNALVEQQSRHGSLALARRDLEWGALVARVAGIVREMPLWKLQTVGGEVDEFLYRRAEEEERFLIFGKTQSGRYLVVAFTERSGRIRIISARPMTPRERRGYEQ